MRSRFRKRGAKSVIRTTAPLSSVSSVDHDRRVAQIFGFDVYQSFHHDIGKSLLLVAGQQAAQNRIAVEARIAPPHDTRTGFEQRGGAPVSNEGEIESVVGHAPSDEAAKPFEPKANVLRPVKIESRPRHDAADGKTYAIEIRQHRECSVIGNIVADEDGFSTNERRNRHHLA